MCWLSCMAPRYQHLQLSLSIYCLRFPVTASTMETLDVEQCYAEISPLFPWVNWIFTQNNLDPCPTETFASRFMNTPTTKQLSIAVSNSSTSPSLSSTTQAQSGSATTSPDSMNCDYPSKCGTKKLKNKLPATSVSWWESVFIIIRLRSYFLIRWSPLATSTRAWQCKHSNWLPYQMQKDFWFSVILNPEKKEISDSVLFMRNQPKRFMNDFTVLFSTSSETFVHGQKARHIELGLDIHSGGKLLSSRLFFHS